MISKNDLLGSLGFALVIGIPSVFVIGSVYTLLLALVLVGLTSINALVRVAARLFRKNTAQSDRAALLPWFLGSVAVIGIGLLGICFSPDPRPVMTKVGLQLEKYHADHGSYPATLSVLVSEKYIDKLPRLNPFGGIGTHELLYFPSTGDQKPSLVSTVIPPFGRLVWTSGKEPVQSLD